MQNHRLSSGGVQCARIGRGVAEWYRAPFRHLKWRIESGALYQTTPDRPITLFWLYITHVLHLETHWSQISTQRRVLFFFFNLLTKFRKMILVRDDFRKVFVKSDLLPRYVR